MFVIYRNFPKTPPNRLYAMQSPCEGGRKCSLYIEFSPKRPQIDCMSAHTHIQWIQEFFAGGVAAWATTFRI